jgi:hypothetical protein
MVITVFFSPANWPLISSMLNKTLVLPGSLLQTVVELVVQ